MIRILTASLCAFVLGVLPALAFDNPYVGVWVGQARDSKGEEFSVAIVITREGYTFIDYADYACGGTLSLVNEDVENQGVFRETITYGAETCIDQGLVTLTVSEKGLAYLWAGQDGGTSVAASGSLQGRPIGAGPTSCADCEVEARLRYHTCGGAAAYLGKGADPEGLSACLKAAGETRQTCRATCEKD